MAVLHVKSPDAIQTDLDLDNMGRPVESSYDSTDYSWYRVYE